MKTLLQLCIAVETALNACRDDAGTRRDYEYAAGDLVEAQRLLGARHAEIRDMCTAKGSPKLALRNALRSQVPPDGMLLYRGVAYWIDDTSEERIVHPDAFSTLSSEQLAEKLGCEILADYRHVIVVRPRGAK